MKKLWALLPIGLVALFMSLNQTNQFIMAGALVILFWACVVAACLYVPYRFLRFILENPT